MAVTFTIFFLLIGNYYWQNMQVFENRLFFYILSRNYRLLWNEYTFFLRPSYKVYYLKAFMHNSKCKSVQFIMIHKIITIALFIARMITKKTKLLNISIFLFLLQKIEFLLFWYSSGMNQAFPFWNCFDRLIHIRHNTFSLYAQHFCSYFIYRYCNSIQLLAGWHFFYLFR